MQVHFGLPAEGVSAFGVKPSVSVVKRITPFNVTKREMKKVPLNF